MKPTSRKLFLQQCISVGAFVGLAPFLTSVQHNIVKDDFYKRVVEANNEEVAKLITLLAPPITDVKRRLGYDMANFAASFCEPTSRYYQDEKLIPYLSKIVHALIDAQHTDGTLDLGNIASPPDTAFILEPLCATATILQTNTSAGLADVKALLKQFIVKAGEALRTGGVHTPNHRWVVSAALAKINALFPNTGYVTRINEWLSEGVYCDREGHYLERSMIYSEVIDRALITIARLQKLPKLLESVRKNLDLTYYYSEPNGDLVTNDSRRQDQYFTVNMLPYFHNYLYMAIHDNNADYAAITKFIETISGFDNIILKDLLPYYLEEPFYKKVLPEPSKLSVRFDKFFKETNLVRIRRDTTTTTIFGGTDLPLIIASGRSNSPNFFAFRKGEAVLNYMRLSTDFFNTGYFHSKGITHTDGKYTLHRTLESPYYQPLPKQYKRVDGNYKHSLSTDGRFWNKMDFEHRPQSNINTLAIRVDVQEKDAANTLTFDIEGTPGVHMVIEFCFKSGGRLTGPTRLADSDADYSLASGFGEYSFGKDTIKFGPGTFSHSKVTGLEGEVYSSHFGSLRTSGMHVYFTGITPFQHTIQLS